MGSRYGRRTLSSAEGFQKALYHLHDEAVAAGWAVPAHFIDVAAEAMQTHIFESKIDPANGIPIQAAGTPAAPAWKNSKGPKLPCKPDEAVGSRRSQRSARRN